MSFINNNPYFHSLISEELKKSGLQELDDPSSSDKIFYCDISYGNRNHPNYSKCEIVNQLQNVNPLGNKKDQYNIHLNYYKTRPDYIPLTISFNRNSLEELKQLFVSNPRDDPPVYIVKPENSLSRTGVGVVRNYLELMSHLDHYSDYQEWIIQDYIDNPLLFNNKKFHFRIYVIYVQTENSTTAYLSKNGFIYTANKEFESDTFDPNIVLSGENSKNNVFYIPEDFTRSFGKQVWETVVVPQIVKITRETIRSTVEHLKCPTKKQKCFKILGYDILINNDYKCFLAEINARNVSYKYPNQKFKDTFYKNILKLVLSKTSLSTPELIKAKLPYERIFFKNDGTIVEGFNNINNHNFKSKKTFYNYYRNIFFPFLMLILIFVVFQLRH
jgi:tubulin monoglycylase TTLL3/8